MALMELSTRQPVQLHVPELIEGARRFCLCFYNFMQNLVEIVDYLLCFKHNNADCCPDGEITLNCEINGQSVVY